MTASHAYSGYVGEWLRLAFPSTVPNESRMVVTLTAYFDESGTHGPSRAMAFAGYLSTPEKWQAFEIEWKRALADFGLTFWHTTDFVAEKRKYEGWPEEVRRSRYARLADIIRRHVVYSVGTLISVADYERAIEPHLREEWDGPYGAATAGTLITVGEYARDHGVQVKYVFEDGVKGAEAVLRRYRRLTHSRPAKRLLRAVGLEFADKRDFVPLQAADMLANELYRDLPVFLGQQRRPDAALWRIEQLAEVPRSWGALAYEQLEVFARAMSLSQLNAIDHAFPPPKRRRRRRGPNR